MCLKICWNIRCLQELRFISVLYLIDGDIFILTYCRHISFASCYRVTDQILCRYLKPVFHQVETLDLNHCYWLTYSAYDAIGRCVNLQTLNVLQCRITPKHLCLILARLTKLRSLAVTIVDMQTFQAELHSSGGAQKVMQNLRCLTLHFRGTLQYTGHHIKMQFEGGSRFLDYFYSLEELHVLGFPNSNKGIPPYVLYSLVGDLFPVDGCEHVQACLGAYACTHVYTHMHIHMQ